MSVEDKATVDLIGMDPRSGKIILTITDHLDWENVETHLRTLQDKINTYLDFIRSGEILVSYPAASGRENVIEVVFKYDPTHEAVRFLSEASSELSDLDIELRSKVKPTSDARLWVS